METNNPDSYRKKIEIVNGVSMELMPELPYHNFRHALNVYFAADNLACLAGINREDRFLLKTASLLHDVILVPGKKDNEEKSAAFACLYLPRIGYSSYQTEQIGKLILATKMPQNPYSFLEEIICDADLDNFGRSDFFKLGECVRRELGLPEDENWYKIQLRLLKDHRYH
ncbi:MAG: HD domain-containing protein, partial [Candidatus Paceibacterota bacterium]